MTLQQLKAILDNGGAIRRGKEKIWKDLLGYTYSDDNSDWQSVKEIKIDLLIGDPSEWSEVKPERKYNIPECPELEHNPKGLYFNFSSPYERDKDIEPRVMIIEVNGQKFIGVPVEVWKKDQDELDQLRAFKANHSATFDAPVEYGKEYPIGGYAPGFYSCICVSCKEEFQGDKRAVQCEHCAIKESQTQYLTKVRLEE